MSNSPNKGVRLFQWRGVVFSADYSLLFFLFLALCSLRLRLFPYFYSDLSVATYWTMAILTTVGLGLSVVAHEMVHVAAARKVGARPHGIFLYVLGTGAPVEWVGGSRWGRARLYLSGVAFSLSLAVALMALAFLSDTNARGVILTGVLSHLAAFNLTLAAFQILPVLSLDGGKLLLSLGSRRGEVRPWVARALYALGTLVGLCFVVAGAFHIHEQRPVLGAWLLIVGSVCLRSNLEEYDYLRSRAHLRGRPI